MTGIKHLTCKLSDAGKRAFKRAVCHARRAYPSHDKRRPYVMRNYFACEMDRLKGM